LRKAKRKRKEGEKKEEQRKQEFQRELEREEERKQEFQRELEREETEETGNCGQSGPRGHVQGTTRVTEDRSRTPKI
jgi:hypothetical protein